jgi:hypothetical protein
LNILLFPFHSREIFSLHAFEIFIFGERKDDNLIYKLYHVQKVDYKNNIFKVFAT